MKSIVLIDILHSLIGSSPCVGSSRLLMSQHCIPLWSEIQGGRNGGDGKVQNNDWRTRWVMVENPQAWGKAFISRRKLKFFGLLETHAHVSTPGHSKLWNMECKRWLLQKVIMFPKKKDLLLPGFLATHSLNEAKSLSRRLLDNGIMYIILAASSWETSNLLR